MNIKALAILAVTAVTAVSFQSCSGSQKEQKADETAQVKSDILEVDSLLANAENLVDKKVKVEAVCTHICKHAGRKIFLMGSDDKNTIRVEACEIGSFPAECVNSIVYVEGVLREDRIDEAYLQNWEAQLKAAGEQHGNNGQAGCNTEKNARQETADTPEGRIEDFRQRIAERKAKTGKDYLSFYHIDAEKYEIKQ
jgi:hypothetical protein